MNEREEEEGRTRTQRVAKNDWTATATTVPSVTDSASGPMRSEMALLVRFWSLPWSTSDCVEFGKVSFARSFSREMVANDAPRGWRWP